MNDTSSHAFGSPGIAQIRDLGFYLVGKDRWIDLKRERRYRLLSPGPALPALEIVHHGDDYQTPIVTSEAFPTGQLGAGWAFDRSLPR